MTRRIGFADVRLDFDDGAARADAAPVVHEHLAEQIAGDVERGTIVEGARQFHAARGIALAGVAGSRCEAARRRARRPATTCGSRSRSSGSTSGSAADRRRGRARRRRPARMPRIRILQLARERRRAAGRELDQILLRLVAQLRPRQRFGNRRRSARSPDRPTRRRRPAARRRCVSLAERRLDRRQLRRDRRSAPALRSRCRCSAALFAVSCAVKSGTLRRMRDARQRVERGFRRFALAVVLEQIGQRLDAALVAHRAERLHRRALDGAVVVVERRDRPRRRRVVSIGSSCARRANTRPMTRTAA